MVLLLSGEGGMTSSLFRMRWGRGWIEDADQLEHHATNYFKELFSDMGFSMTEDLQDSFPALEDADMLDISRPISNEEIQNTIKSFGAFKAPGPDGFQAIFYQSQWSIIEKSFCNLIHRIIDNPIRHSSPSFPKLIW